MKELNENSIQYGEQKKDYKHLIIYFIIALILILFFVMIFSFTAKFSKDVGTMEFVELEGFKIPTLYKYTEYNDTFFDMHEVKVKEDDAEVVYSIVFCNNEIPDNVKEEYFRELLELGYTSVEYKDSTLYVLNVDNNSKFIYIIVDGTQMKYAVCLSGRYEDVLK